MEKLDPALVYAKNAKGSVAIADMNRFFEKAPIDKHFWDYDVIGAIHEWAGPNSRGKDIRIADLGCGTGKKLAYICDDSIRYGLKVSAFGMDIVPSNLYAAKNEIKMCPTVSVKFVLGDIRNGIPFDKLHFVLISEVAHWMEKEEFQFVLNDVSSRCNPGANIVVSYATRFNSSALTNRDGIIDKKLIPRRIKGYGYSFACKTNMSWYNLEEMKVMGKKAGLRPVNFEYISNVFFPAVNRQTGISYSGSCDVVENEVIRFKKPSCA